MGVTCPEEGNADPSVWRGVVCTLNCHVPLHTLWVLSVTHILTVMWKVLYFPSLEGTKWWLFERDVVTKVPSCPTIPTGVLSLGMFNTNHGKAAGALLPPSRPLFAFLHQVDCSILLQQFWFSSKGFIFHTGLVVKTQFCFFWGPGERYYGEHTKPTEFWASFHVKNIIRESSPWLYSSLPLISRRAPILLVRYQRMCECILFEMSGLCSLGWCERVDVSPMATTWRQTQTVWGSCWLDHSPTCFQGEKRGLHIV